MLQYIVKKFLNFRKRLFPKERKKHFNIQYLQQQQNKDIPFDKQNCIINGPKYCPPQAGAQQRGVIFYFLRFSKMDTLLPIRYIFMSSIICLPLGRPAHARGSASAATFLFSKFTWTIKMNSFFYIFANTVPSFYINEHSLNRKLKLNKKNYVGPHNGQNGH